MALTLTIYHNIHLTREQRYSLHAGKAVDVVGVSVPVWFNKSVTSEPGKEIFCRYYLHNDGSQNQLKILNDGYQLTIPQQLSTQPPISDEIWRSLSHKELEAYYENREVDVSTKNLLDLKDGGSEYMFYREITKVNSSGGLLTVVHFISIKSSDQLEDTIEF
jgi:hypothetical protein